MKVSVSNSGAINQLQKSPEQTLNTFITSIAENRQAFDVFKVHAQKRGIMQGPKPLIHSQHEYYERFINQKQRAVSTLTFYNDKTNSSIMPLISQPQIGSTLKKKKALNFTPLKDLLTKNHDDRVKDYLNKMEGLTMEEVIHSQSLNQSHVKKSREDDTLGTAKQLQIVDSLRSQANSILKKNDEKRPSNVAEIKLLNDDHILKKIIKPTQQTISIVPQKINKPEPSKIIDESLNTIKKKTGVKAAKLMAQKPQFKLQRNDKLKAYFEKFAGGDRLTRLRFNEMMASRYPIGEYNAEGKYQASLCDSMIRQLWQILDERGSDLKYDTYCDKIEKWMNQDDIALKRFVFECYDTLYCEKITEESLFKLLNVVSTRAPQINLEPTELLSLHEHDSDMFLDIFAADFVKILQTLDAKKKVLANKKSELANNGKMTKNFSSLGRSNLIDSIARNYSDEKQVSPKGLGVSMFSQDLKSDNKEESVYLTIDEFNNIDFGLQYGDQFAIVNDVLAHLTGIKFSNSTVKVDLDSQVKVPVLPTAGNDEELQQFKEFMPDSVYKSIERAFRKLWGYPDNIIPDTEIEGIPFLIEKNFQKNIKFVIGVDCPFFGKMLYLYFSKGLDKAKISLPMFFTGLRPYLIDEERQKHNQTSFKILDIDNDGLLNIINLMQLFKNIPTNTKLGQEIFKVIEYFQEKNKKKSILQKLEINLDVYLKLNNQKMCLTNEIRSRFLGLQNKTNGEAGIIHFDSEDPDEEEVQKNKKRFHSKFNTGPQKVSAPEYVSILQPINEPDYDKSVSKQYLFQNIDLLDDTSKGERGFNRNIERLGNQLIQFYKTSYPRDAEVTMNQLEKLQEQQRLLKRKQAQEEAQSIKLQLQKQASVTSVASVEIHI